MSGEAVVFMALTTPAGIATLAGIGAIMAGSIAMSLIQRYQQAQYQAAEAAMQVKQKDIQQWQQYQAEQQKQIEHYQKTQALLKNLPTQPLSSPPSFLEAQAATPARGFLAEDPELSAARQRLQWSMVALAGLPPALLQQSVFSALQQQALALQNQLETEAPLAQQAIIAQLPVFQATVTQTITHHIQQQEQTAQAAQALLQNLLLYQTLAEATPYAAEIHTLQQQLYYQLEQPAVLGQHLGFLQQQFQQLQAQIEHIRQHQAIQHSIHERLHTHLTAMGYQYLEANQAWLIPGGEQVKVALDAQHRLVFQLQHEIITDAHAGHETNEKPVLDPAALAFFRQQEKKWCQDLSQLIRKLVADGFQYQIQFEREAPEAAIPIVVIEDVQSILAQQDEEEVVAHLQQPLQREWP